MIRSVERFGVGLDSLHLHLLGDPILVLTELRLCRHFGRVRLPDRLRPNEQLHLVDLSFCDAGLEFRIGQFQYSLRFIMLGVKLARAEVVGATLFG